MKTYTFGQVQKALKGKSKDQVTDLDIKSYDENRIWFSLTLNKAAKAFHSKKKIC